MISNYGWVKLDLGSGNESILTRYSICTYNSDNYKPTNWTIEGSNLTSGFNYTLDDKKGQTLTKNVCTNYTINNTFKTRYITIYLTQSTGGSAILLEEMPLYFNTTLPSPTNATYVLNITKVPADINSSSFQDSEYNLSVTSPNVNISSLTNPTATLYQRIITTLNGGCAIFNQTQCLNTGIYFNHSMTKINNSLFTHNISDAEIFPAYYPFDENIIESTVGSNHSIYMNNYVKFNIYNFSTQVNDYFISVEFDAVNTTGTSGAMVISYCNSSYTTGSVLLSPNCVVVDSFTPDVRFFHIHNFSRQNIVPITIRNVTKTQLSYIIFQASGNLANAWNFRVINNSKYNNASFNIGNALTWSNTSEIFDVHIHPFNANDYIEYYADYNDNNGTLTTGSAVKDFFNITEFPPSLPVIFEPSCNQQYTLQENNSLSIFFNWSVITDVNLDNFTYKINLLNGLSNISVLSLNFQNTSTTQSYNASINYSSITNGSWMIEQTVNDSFGFSDSQNVCDIDICRNVWIPSIQPCINNVQILSYIDANNCNAKYDLPSDNGTYILCVAPPITTNINISSEGVKLGFTDNTYKNVIIIFIVIFLAYLGSKGKEWYRLFLGLSGCIVIVLPILLFNSYSNTSISEWTIRILFIIGGASMILISILSWIEDVINKMSVKK